MAAGTVCVKVASLRSMRPRSYDNIFEWMSAPNHVYVGRAGRVSVKSKNGGSPSVRWYAGSKWQNPFPINKEAKEPAKELDRVLTLYKAHLYQKRKDGTRLVDEIDELRGKVLGCFCDQSHPCHAQILAREIKHRQQTDQSQPPNQPTPNKPPN